MKKYDEDLNTTLIFVCCPHRSGLCVLTRLTGRSVLSRDLSVYHRGQFPTPAGPE